MPAGDGVFTYRIPATLGAPRAGQRVVVPLGRRTGTGVVLGPAEPQAAVRDALRLLDGEPLLTEEIVQLARWASLHYLAPLGPVLRAALPPGIDVRDELVPHLTEEARKLLEGGQLDLPGQASALRRALRKAASGSRLSRKLLLSLQQKGLVVLSRAEAPARVPAPLIEMAQAMSGADVSSLRKAPRQAEILEWILARAREVPVEELVAAFPRARPQLRGLAARKLISINRVPAGPARLEDAPWGTQSHDPTPAQARALREIVDARGFAPFLLHGVTGSGKTWVYLEAIAHFRTHDKGALALVPEIALTPQLAGRFRARFGGDVAVLHSGLSERERVAEWTRVREGRAGIVVGARGAVWAPVQRLGIIVVDEEHEPSYKQEERLRYHARDLALVRAQKAAAVIVLGSATPSLESLRRAQEGKLRTLSLPERVDARPLPEIVFLRRGPDEVLTEELAQALRDTLTRGEQAIIFLNRRGHTRTLLCTACGSALGCPNCSVALVLHRAGGEKLRCHLCGHEELPGARCAACSGTRLRELGAGTEKAEEALQDTLPQARIARLDRDAAGGPGKAAAVLARFARRELDVLVGTQMVAKGHDFPGVTLVGILDADGPLHLPDFRAAERCVQLLTQAAGRAGRGREPGRVLVQAFRPEAVAVDYAAFAREELRRREALEFPPFSRLVAVRLQGNSETAVRGAAERAANSARRLVAAGERADVLGPAPAPLSRIRGKHRWQILLRAHDHGPLHRIAQKLLRDPGVSGVELAVDVDPVALL